MERGAAAKEVTELKSELLQVQAQLAATRMEREREIAAREAAISAGDARCAELEQSIGAVDKVLRHMHACGAGQAVRQAGGQAARYARPRPR